MSDSASSYDASESSYRQPDPAPGARTPRWYRLRPHALQRRVLRERLKYKYVILPCGRRSGKTELAKRHVVDLATTPMRNPERAYGIGAPTHDQTRAIYWNDIKALSGPAGGKYVKPGGISESERTIHYRTGAMIQLVGMDKPQRMEGRPWDGFLLDEFADMKADVLQAHVLPALADRDGWLWLYGVPEGRNHYWEQWQRAQTDPRWLALTWKSDTVLPASIVADLKRDMDARTIAQELEASFLEVSGKIYYAFDRELNVRAFNRPQGVEWCVGMDFNVSPLCAVVFFVLNDVMYVWDEYHVDGASTQFVGEEMKRDGIFPATVYPDPSGRARKTSAGYDTTDHSILRNLGFTVLSRPAAPSLRARYNAVNSRLCNANGERRIIVHPQCKHLIKSLDGQAYPEGRSAEDPHDVLGHMNAALGYPVEYIWPVRRVDGAMEVGRF